jgi:hypothetical protein
MNSDESVIYMAMDRHFPVVRRYLLIFFWSNPRSFRYRNVDPVDLNVIKGAGLISR